MVKLPYVVNKHQNTFIREMLFHQPTHPVAPAILAIGIAIHIKFRVNSTGENFSKWWQIFLFLLTMYKTMDHVTEGAAPQDPDDN
jgi:hypothetical protein